MSKEYLDKAGLTYLWSKLKAYFQVKLVSGTNIKTVNNNSLLGSGNISITGNVTGVKGNAESSYRTGNVNLTAANVGAVAKNDNNSVYTNTASAYIGSSASLPYWKVTLPSSISTLWTIITLYFNVQQSYSAGYAGSIIVSGYHNTTGDWSGLYYSTIGNLSSAVKVHSTNGNVFYIEGLTGGYFNIDLEKMLVADAARGKDLSEVTIERVASLPETYTTAVFRQNRFVGDSNTGQATTFAYSKDGLTTASWLAAWNSYELRAISPANVRTTINAVDKDGDTMNGDLLRSISTGSVLPAAATSMFQSPIPKYLWHDIFAFCRASTPKYYTTTNGTTWTESTLEKRLFSQQEAWGSVAVLDSTIKGSRWEWGVNSGFYASLASWLVVGVMYSSTISHFDLLLETRPDTDSDWTTLCDVKNIFYSTTPLWIKLSGTCQSSVRLTITNNSQSASGASLPICSIKLLTYRWGNQGKGSEYEHPYLWDGDGNVTPIPGGSIMATKVNNHTVNSDVPSNAKFTDTVTTATTTGSGNAVTAITATNGALSVTKGTTFLTQHQDISGKADKSATVSTVTWDSTNKKFTKTINGTTTDIVTAANLRTGLNVADGAEVNQNAFSNVTVGSTTIAADSKTDTLTLTAGSNVTLTPDATNDKITIAATDTTYESKAAASGGTAVSLVTTGEKYTWNNKSTVPTNHASSATTYGTGTSSNYGHLKLSDSTSSTSGTSGGIAATPSAVKSAYDLANTANGTANTALSGVNGNLIYDHTFSISNGVATFTPHVYQKGAEVTTNYAASCFVWKYRLINGSEVTLTTKSNRGCDVTISNLGYGGHVIGSFTPPSS